VSCGRPLYAPGALVAAVGPWRIFVLNTLSYIGFIAVLMDWRREHRESALPR
jgi:transmembrane secretion effector